MSDIFLGTFYRLQCFHHGKLVIPLSKTTASSYADCMEKCSETVSFRHQIIDSAHSIGCAGACNQGLLRLPGDEHDSYIIWSFLFTKYPRDRMESHPHLLSRRLLQTFRVETKALNMLSFRETISMEHQ